ncbi:DUF1338-domain-containing protein [Aspergillus heterothallicus]
MTSTLPLPSKHGHQAPLAEAFIEKDALRTTFAFALSTMYKAEVPLYGDLVRIVHDINTPAHAQSATLSSESPSRLTLERHGAIRLGTPAELHTMRRVFELLGMEPVGYYDLSIAGLPMHATCFRPVTAAALAQNPFRVFTTLLRPELLKSTAARDTAMAILAKRRIFTDELLEILDLAETQQGGYLTAPQAESFIAQAMLTFGWRSVAAATRDEYELLKSEHPILADIACFRSAHINHLTPRTLDIGVAQEDMRAAGMAVKSRIEGPPARECPILLRQTSFLALEEKIRFQTREDDRDGGEFAQGSHKARFGEIEERGAAVTLAGRRLYDELLGKAMNRAAAEGGDVDAVLTEVFQAYPDSWAELRQRGLVYFEYRCTGKMVNVPDIMIADARSEDLLEKLIAEKIVEAVPITYEDFLPLSAAGIFQSNLQGNGQASASAVNEKMVGGDKEGYERALGCTVMDADDIYASLQRESIKVCARKLGLPIL